MKYYLIGALIGAAVMFAIVMLISEIKKRKSKPEFQKVYTPE